MIISWLRVASKVVKRMKIFSKMINSFFIIEIIFIILAITAVKFGIQDILFFRYIGIIAILCSPVALILASVYVIINITICICEKYISKPKAITILLCFSQIIAILCLWYEIFESIRWIR